MTKIHQEAADRLGLVEEVFHDVGRVVVGTAGAKCLRAGCEETMSFGRGPFESRIFSRVTD